MIPKQKISGKFLGQKKSLALSTNNFFRLKNAELCAINNNREKHNKKKEFEV